MRMILFLLGCGLLIGCGAASSGPVECVVVGEVTLDGKTLTMGEVFMSNSEGTQSGRGEIAGDGKFRVPSAPVGQVKVAVRTTPYARFAGETKQGGKAVTMGQREGTYVPVPKHYEDIATSKLTYTIPKQKEFTLKIELSSK